MYCSTAVCRADSGTVARLLSGVAVRTRYRGDTPAHAGRPFERIAGRALQGRAAALASCFDSSLRPGWQHYHSTRYSNLLDHGRAWIGVAWREATRLANGDDNARSAEQPRNCRSGGSGDTVRRAYLALVPRSRSGGPSSRSDDRICSTTTSRRRCYHGVRAIQRGRRPPPCARLASRQRDVPAPAVGACAKLQGASRNRLRFRQVQLDVSIDGRMAAAPVAPFASDPEQHFTVPTAAGRQARTHDAP